MVVVRVTRRPFDITVWEDTCRLDPIPMEDEEEKEVLWKPPPPASMELFIIEPIIGPIAKPPSMGPSALPNGAALAPKAR